MLKKTLVLLDAGQVMPDRPLVERRGADTWRRAAVGGVCLGVSLSERSERSRGLSYIYKKEKTASSTVSRRSGIYMRGVYVYAWGFYI